MSFLLFVARNKRRPNELCPGSALCSEFIENISEDDLEVVDCNAADFKRPAWMTGTPTLFEHSTHKIWTGKMAVMRLYHLSLHHVMNSKPVVPAVKSPTKKMPNPPPPESSTPEENAMEDNVWTSNIIDETNVEDIRSDRKMTEDDLQKAISARQATMTRDPSVGAHPPPPPPFSD